MFPWECRFIEVDLEILGTIFFYQLHLDYLMIHFELNRQQITNLLEVNLLLLPFDLQELFDNSFRHLNLLQRAYKDHFPRVIREIVEWMSQVLPVAHHLLDPYLARIDLHLDFFDVIHDQLTLTHLHKNGLHFYLLELLLDQLVDVAGFARITKNSQLRRLVQSEHVIG